MPLNLVGKIYYSSPDILTVEDGTFSYHRPLAGFIIDNRGQFSTAWADSNVVATVYFIAVSDRPGILSPRDTTLHTDLLKSGTVNFLGVTFAAAQAAVRETYGSAVADAMVEQFVSGD